jgi:hypothetical protein
MGDIPSIFDGLHDGGSIFGVHGVFKFSSPLEGSATFSGAPLTARERVAGIRFERAVVRDIFEKVRAMSTKSVFSFSRLSWERMVLGSIIIFLLGAIAVLYLLLAQDRKWSGALANEHDRLKRHVGERERRIEELESALKSEDIKPPDDKTFLTWVEVYTQRALKSEPGKMQNNVLLEFATDLQTLRRK